MKKYSLIALALVALLVAGAVYALTVGSSAPLAPVTPVDAEANPNCPRDIYCLDIYDPVICNDGQIYSNECYAYRECANGCRPL